MEDANIYIRSLVGGARSGARQKLSAKGTIQRNKATMNIASNIKGIGGKASSALSSASSGSSSLSIGKILGKVGSAVGIVGVTITLADKVARFGVSLQEARTGEQVRAHNARTLLNTIKTGGMNYAYKFLENEIFNKKVISRQNYGKDYGRELYQVNIEGTKNKRI